MEDDDSDNPPDDIDTSLPEEEQQVEADRRDKFYHDLREVSF
jgi:hypothetical protein